MSTVNVIEIIKSLFKLSDFYISLKGSRKKKKKKKEWGRKELKGGGEKGQETENLLS